MRDLDVLFAAERLLPAAGGAEQAALEQLGALADRGHRVRAVWVAAGSEGEDAGQLPTGIEGLRVAAPPAPAGYWAGKRARREVLRDAVAGALSERRADVLCTQLHGGPGAAEAAAEAGVPVVVHLRSYEALCKYAFDHGSACLPGARCEACPSAQRLDAGERAELRASRAAHERTLNAAARLLAPSRAVAAACAAWTGRAAVVVPDPPPVMAPAHGDPAGPVVAVATRWNANKGADLLPALAHGLRGRRMVVTAGGLDPAQRAALRSCPGVELVPNAPVAMLLRGAGCLVVLSQWPEPFGRIAFEGLAAGIPTVASGVGGLTEFVPVDQLVTPPGDAAACARAIAALAVPSRWVAARDAGLTAAAAVLAARPLDALESVLRGAAAARPAGAPA